MKYFISSDILFIYENKVDTSYYFTFLVYGQIDTLSKNETSTSNKNKVEVKFFI